MQPKTSRAYSLYLPDDQMNRMRAIATEEDRPASYVVAQAITEFLTRRDDWQGMAT